MVNYGSVVENVDFSLPRRGEITGVVRDSAGNPLGGVNVYAAPTSWCCGSGAYTEPDGSYTIPGLLSSEYRVVASNDAYLTRYWNQGGGTHVWGEADAVAVTSEHTTGSIDLQMFRPSTIRGRVTVSAGEPVPWVTVSLMRSDGSGCCYGYAYTDWNGEYRINAQAGDFFVHVWSWPYLDTFWSSTQGSGTRQSAEVVSISAEAQITGIDIALKRPGSSHRHRP